MLTSKRSCKPEGSSQLVTARMVLQFVIAKHPMLKHPVRGEVRGGEGKSTHSLQSNEHNKIVILCTIFVSRFFYMFAAVCNVCERFQHWTNDATHAERKRSRSAIGGDHFLGAWGSQACQSFLDQSVSERATEVSIR